MGQNPSLVARISWITFWCTPTFVLAQNSGLDHPDRAVLGEESAAAAAVDHAFSYQAFVVEDETPVNGLREFTWAFYDDAACTDPSITSITEWVPIEDGVLSTVLRPRADLFTGRAIWIEPSTPYASLGCAPVTATPCALSLQPGRR